MPPMHEFELLKHVYSANAALPRTVSIPPGDDMGGLRLPPVAAGSANEILVTVDQILDGVHIDAARTPLEKIARKAITRNLSDVAAMAALPLGAVVAVALPRNFGADRATMLFDHLRQVAAHYDCPLIGGDISMWDHPLLMSVTVLATRAGIEPMLRRGAKVGDVICVTGHLGGSTLTVDGCTHHLDFEPRLSLARKLAGDPERRPHCMIDLSDGLARDVGHLCDAGEDGGVSALLWADKLPVSRAAHAASHSDRVSPWWHALSDGEDYELCFTVSAHQAETSLPAAIDGVPITQVGIMTQANGKPGVSVQMPNGDIMPADDAGWEHHGQ